jgi:hypothetical protein
VSGAEIIVDYDPDRLILRAGGPPVLDADSARQFMGALSGRVEEYDVFAEEGPEPVIRVAREMGDNGEVRVVLYASARSHIASMERIAGRIRAALPEWPPADENYSAASVLEGGQFYGQRVSETLYRVEAILQGHPAHHNEQVALLGRYCSERYDPDGALVYLVTSRKDTGRGVISKGTDPTDFLQGPRGLMRARPEFTPVACSEVVMADNPDLNVRLRWPGPEFSLRVRAPRVGAVMIMQDLLAAWRATLQRPDHPLVEAYGFGPLRRMMGF